MTRVLTLLVVFFISCSIVLAASGGPQNELFVSFSGRQITAAGVTPRGAVVFYGVGLFARGVDTGRFAQKGVVQDSGSGTVQFVCAEDIPANSAWAIVDVTTGHFSVVRASGAVNEVKLVPNAFRKGANGDVNVLAYPAIEMHGLYVHPGHGVLAWQAIDGGSSDADGHANGVIVCSLDRSKPLVEVTDIGRKFAPGGVFIAFDYWQLRVLALRIDGGMLAGAK